jgi:predicted aldo/keto reductase-like oxidoreductase
MISASKIIIGTANFDKRYGILNNKCDYKNINKVLNFSKKKKIKFLEVSKDYNNFKFKSKKILRNFKLYKKIDLQHKYFSTGKIYKKIFNYLFEKKENKSCYAVIIRKPNLLLNTKGKRIFNFLTGLKKNKKISKIGITIYDTKNLKKIINNFNIDFIQLPYNFLNYQTFEITKKLIKNKKIEIHIRSIFLQGLLLKKYYELPSELERLSKYWLKIDNYLSSIRMNRYAACLNYAVNSGANKLIIGVNNIKQLKHIFKIKNSKIKFQKFRIKEKKLIDPVYWLKFQKK